MQITWYGLSCFRLTERGMATVVTDPFDDSIVGYEPLKLKADIVTVSHDAPGHNYLAGVKGNTHTLTGAGEFEIGGVFITAIQTSGKKQDGNGRNTLYVFDYDGVTVAHLGDLKRELTQSDVESLGTVNVALVPVGGGEGLTPAKAAEVISLIEPGIVIPMHYKTKDDNLDLAPLSKFLQEMGLSDIEPISSLKVTPSSIPEETKVFVLDYNQKEGHTVTVKILMTWDILPGREQEYFEFVVREWIPRMQKLGLQPNDAWYTYYGNQPQIMASALMNTMPDMERVLTSGDWQDLTQELLEYVEDFSYKIVKARSGFQL